MAHKLSTYRALSLATLSSLDLGYSRFKNLKRECLRIVPSLRTRAIFYIDLTSTEKASAAIMVSSAGRLARKAYAPQEEPTLRRTAEKLARYYEWE